MWISSRYIYLVAQHIAIPVLKDIICYIKTPRPAVAGGSTLGNEICIFLVLCDRAEKLVQRG